MKNNIELFIKYLDDQLSTKQRKDFELNLNNDHDLKMEFEEYSRFLQSTKERIELDESYFTTVLPKARDRMNNSTPNYFGKLSYIIPTIILVISIVYYFNTNKVELNDNLITVSELLDTNEMLPEDLINILEFNRYSKLNEKVLELYFEDNLEIDTTLFEYIEYNLASNEITNMIFEDLTEIEFNTIYQELKNIGEK